MNTEVLHVLFSLSGGKIPPGSVVLSYLAPHEEQALENSYCVVSGNELSQSVKKEAMDLYRKIVADIGKVPMSEQTTFRQEIKKGNEASLWWYHSVSCKNSDEDEEYGNIVRILAIRKTAKKFNSRQIILYGAKSCLARTLSMGYEVKEIRPVSPTPGALFFLYALFSRLRYLLLFCRLSFVLKKYYRLPKTTYDLVLSGFWDWSFWLNDKSNDLEDLYFKKLPQVLKSKGLSAIGYFAWFSSGVKPDAKKKPLAKKIKPLSGREDVVILQSLLTFQDVVNTLLDLRPLKAYRKILIIKEFRETFQRNGMDLFPLFEVSMLKGFSNAQIPDRELVARATERAARRYLPRLSISFLEHFSYSRAHYEGIRRGWQGVNCWAIQHAAYCHQKSIYYLHPDIEFQGSPDKCPVPHPDKIFVMGRLGKKLFLECGYKDNQVCLTGTTRYDYIRPSHEKKNKDVRSNKKEKIILIACSLNAVSEISMVEAVYLASQDIRGLRLRVRNHPFARIELQERYNKLKNEIEISNRTLDDDLASCDLLFFTTSTVGEEAFLRGVPAWQWQLEGYSGSALSEVADIPRFYSVVSLRHALQKFSKDPEMYRPDNQEILKVLEQIFYPSDGKATERCADECFTYLQSFHVNSSHGPSSVH